MHLGSSQSARYAFADRPCAVGEDQRGKTQARHGEDYLAGPKPWHISSPPRSVIRRGVKPIGSRGRRVLADGSMCPGAVERRYGYQDEDGAFFFVVVCGLVFVFVFFGHPDRDEKDERDEKCSDAPKERSISAD